MRFYKGQYYKTASGIRVQVRVVPLTWKLSKREKNGDMNKILCYSKEITETVVANPKAGMSFILSNDVEFREHSLLRYCTQ
jgi:hypothetical protein